MTELTAQWHIFIASHISHKNLKKMPQGLLFNYIFVQLHSLLTEHGFQYVGTLGGKVLSNNCKRYHI